MTLILIGIASGFLAGLLGVGGGGLMVPLLAGIAGYRQRQAHATSLGAVAVLALAAALTYGVADEVRLGTAAALFVGGMLGAPFGALLLSRVDDRLARRAFGVLLIVTAAFMFLT